MTDADPRAATELAKERSRLAADPTLLAWIRTALTLIGFGFMLDRALGYLRTVSPAKTFGRAPLGVKIFGAALVALGTVILIGAAIQHWHALRRIARGEIVYAPIWPLAEAVTIALAATGVYAFATILE